MTADRHIVLYHAHPSRSSGTLGLLEELGADYEVKLISLTDGDNLKPEFLAINPLGKVPTLVHGGAVITEQVAVTIYLADLYPEAGLTPAVGDPLRGPFLRWAAIYGSVFEPAMVDHSQQREPGRRAMSPYGSYEDVVALIDGQLTKTPYLLGEKPYAVDILWGLALNFMTQFGLYPKSDPVMAYIERILARPGVARAQAWKPSA